MMAVSFVMVAVACVLYGCPTPTPPPPKPIPRPVDAGPATCADVCAHWAELDCDEAKDTPGGGTCEDVCIKVQTSGIVEWDLECRATVGACTLIDSCER
jgi:hypothetical protein